MAQTRVLIVEQAFSLPIHSTNSVDSYELEWGRIGLGEPTIGWYLFCEGEQLIVSEGIEHRRKNSIVLFIYPPREGTIDELIQRGHLRE